MDKENIQERIESLKQELQSYSDEIFKQVQSLHSQNLLGFKVDLKHDPRNAVKVLRQDLLDLLEDVDQKSSALEKRSEDLEGCSTMVELLTKVVSLTDAIGICEMSVTSSDISKACTSIVDMEAKLSDLPQGNAEISSGKVFSVLRREVSAIKNRFSSRLRRLFSACVTVDPGHIHILKSIEGMVRGEDLLLESPIKLADILNALELMDSSSESVESFIQQVWAYVLRPLWKEKKLSAPSLYSAEAQAELVFDNIVRDFNTAVASADGATGAQTTDGLRSPYGGRSDFAYPSTCKPTFSALLEQISSTLSFVYNEVFSSNDKISEVAGSFLSSQTLPLMSHLTTTLLNLMPKVESELTTFQKPLEKSCKDFETKMNSFGSFGRNMFSSVPSPLSDIIGDLGSRFGDARRRDILVCARQDLLADYHNTMLGTGDVLEDDTASAGCAGDAKAISDKSGTMQALRFETCQISLASFRTLKRVHEVLQQAVRSSARLAHILYHSARDALELFLAVIPIRFAETIKSSPRMAAVFANDCSYIAHNCTIISHMYRVQLGRVNPDLQDAVGFMDFIPRFRAMGEKALAVQVDTQKTDLMKIVEGRIKINPDVISGPSVASLGFNNEEGTSVLMRELEALKGQWFSVLQDSVYERITGYLLESIFRTAMKPVLEADCISASSGSEVCRIFRTLQRAKSILHSCSEEDMVKVVGGWGKFCALADLLEYRLSEISEMLPKGKFTSFTGPELIALIKALFEDSAQRQQIINAIIDISS